MADRTCTLQELVRSCFYNILGTRTVSNVGNGTVLNGLTRKCTMRVVRARGRVIQHPLSSDFFCSRGGKRPHRYALPGVPRCYIGSYDAYTNLISIWWGTIESKGLEGTFMRN